MDVLPSFVIEFYEYDFSKDINGKDRGIGGKWDLGAYEYDPS